MAHPPPHPIPAASSIAREKAGGRNAWQRAAVWVMRRWAGASDALARAEQRITNNFRQPPHGG